MLHPCLHLSFLSMQLLAVVINSEKIPQAFVSSCGTLKRSLCGMMLGLGKKNVPFLCKFIFLHQFVKLQNSILVNCMTYVRYAWDSGLALEKQLKWLLSHLLNYVSLVSTKSACGCTGTMGLTWFFIDLKCYALRSKGTYTIQPVRIVSLLCYIRILPST